MQKIFYQRQLDDHGLATSVENITWPISQTCDIHFVEASYDEYRYRCKISDAEGYSVTSNAATL